MVIELVCAERAAMVARRRASKASAWFDALDSVKDPEIPVVSIWELGILQDVEANDDHVTVVLTPTYSGCPAMEHITTDVRRTLARAGARQVSVEIRLKPAWSSEWMDKAARRRLSAYGIAPPDDPSCPQCGSSDVETTSEFGSTACKALLRCCSCHEPFDYFKAI